MSVHLPTDLPGCVLRPWRAADKEDLIREANNRKVWRNMTHSFPHPYTGRDACEWLVARGAKVVGYDYPPDHCIRDTIAEPRRRPGRSEYTTHAIFFPAGITVIEYLTNLDRIPAPRCRFIALPLAIEGADGSPVRAIAVVE